MERVQKPVEHDRREDEHEYDPPPHAEHTERPPSLDEVDEILDEYERDMKEEERLKEALQHRSLEDVRRMGLELCSRAIDMEFDLLALKHMGRRPRYL